jgi:hypothetical protein
MTDLLSIEKPETLASPPPASNLPKMNRRGQVLHA